MKTGFQINSTNRKQYLSSIDGQLQVWWANNGSKRGLWAVTDANRVVIEKAAHMESAIAKLLKKVA